MMALMIMELKTTVQATSAGYGIWKGLAVAAAVAAAATVGVVGTRISGEEEGAEASVKRKSWLGLLETGEAGGAAAATAANWRAWSVTNSTTEEEAGAGNERPKGADPAVSIPRKKGKLIKD